MSFLTPLELLLRIFFLRGRGGGVLGICVRYMNSSVVYMYIRSRYVKGLACCRVLLYCRTNCCRLTFFTYINIFFLRRRIENFESIPIAAFLSYVCVVRRIETVPTQIYFGHTLPGE